MNLFKHLFRVRFLPALILIGCVSLSVRLYQVIISL